MTIQHIIACDPGAKGGFAVFKLDGSDGPEFIGAYKTQDWRDLVNDEYPNAIGIFEANHGIARQSAGTSYTQGYNTGNDHRLLELLCDKVIKVIPQKWMRILGVPVGMEKDARKHWIQDKAQKIVNMELPLWASDAVAIGLSYIKETKNNE